MNQYKDESTADKSVPPSEYDGRYFFASCEGYEEFQASGGRKLGPRFQKALQLARIQPGQRILDIGCGRGELVIHAAMRGAQAVGIDYAEEAVGIARETLATYPQEVQERASALLMNARNLEFEDESFDTALATDIVEHLYPQELAEALTEARRVLRPGGRLVIHTSPNRLSYDVAYPVYVRQAHRVICRLAGLARYQSYFINQSLPRGAQYPRSDDERRLHVNEQTTPQLAHTLTESGFRVVKIEYWEPPQALLASPRLTIELMLLDSVRFLRPFSYHWPLNRLFTNHIWMVAEKQ